MRSRRRKTARPPINSSGIFLLSDREITVSKCEKVEKYCPNEVVLKLSDMKLTIIGENMSFSVCYGCEIKLAGAIKELKIQK